MSRDTAPSTRQLTLPGQAHTAQGPHDQTGMYVMHHAFRRDLARFVAAVGATPTGDSRTWKALSRRWDRMAVALHHHHEIEDAALWPALRRAAEAAGSNDDLSLLSAMEAEHGVIDPALAAVRERFEAMLTHPCTDHRNALEIRVVAVREALERHLAHEETEALPMLQRTLSVADNDAFEKAAAKGYPLRMLPFLLSWTLDGLPDEARDRILRMAPPGSRLLLQLLEGGHQRRERRAFGWLSRSS
jgi:iron-sulfur cluster repair protein YtfE (RIC family)